MTSSINLLLKPVRPEAVSEMQLGSDICFSGTVRKHYYILLYNAGKQL